MELYTYKIKEITKIYDGDTITAVIDLGMFISITEKIRLMGINTPEIRGEERSEGLKSKAWLEETLGDAIIADKEIYVKTVLDKKGKYGRLLGYLYIEGQDISVNEQLVKAGFAEFREY
jgi:micrococcal nuclease